MHSAHFFEGTRPGQHGGRRIKHQVASSQNQPWNGLAEQQALYEELLASQQGPRKRRSLSPSTRTPSVQELTRELAGWSLPQAPTHRG